MKLFAVGLSTIETLLRRIGRTDDDAGIRTRLKYLQRMSFPAGTNSGRGRRAAYDLDQLLQVLCCFQLMQLGLPPTRSLRTVRTGWATLRAPLAFGWLARNDHDLLRRRPLLLLDRSALDDGREGEDPTEPISNPLRAIAVEELLGSATGGTFHVICAVLDPSALAAGLADAIAEPGTDLTVEELDKAFLAYWQATTDLHPEDWSINRSADERDHGEVVPFRMKLEAASRRGRPAA